MKKLLTLIFVTLFLFTSCKEETPKEVEETVLPQPDENTKVIEISFSEDFYEYEYTEPVLVSPEEFEWGDYVPFVRLDDFYYKENNTPKYAILSDFSPTLQEGENLYSHINTLFSNTQEDKSKVLYISPDFDIVGRFSLISKEESTDGLYEIICDGKVADYFYKNELSPEEYTLGFHTYWEPVSEYYRKSKKLILWEDDVSISPFSPNCKTVVLYKKDKQIKSYYFYDVLKNEITHQIKLDSKGSLSANNSSKFLITFADVTETDFLEKTYLYDTETQKATYIGDYLYNASLSYDGKYVLYTSPSGEDLPDVNADLSELLDINSGIYIKNLENNTTVYYETSGFYNTHGIIEWINKDKLIDLIQKNGGRKTALFS